MKTKASRSFIAAFGFLFSMNAAAASTLIQNIRVFDGEKIFLNRNVLFEQDKIVDINFKDEIKKDTIIIDGKNRTLLPGLIDSHVHAYQDQDLPLLYGVTTQIDMFSAASLVQEMNTRMQAGKNKDRPDLFSAGILATAPGGHGTEYGMNIETLTEPSQAQAWVDKRIAEGSYFIKIVMEHGSEQHKVPSLNLDTVKALIQAAHARKKLAVVHISNFQDARAALAAGADGLVHLFNGTAITKQEINDLVTLAKSRKAFVIPTFSVLESMAGVKEQDVLNDSTLMSLLTKAQVRPLNVPYGKQESLALLIAPKVLTASLVAARVPILAGTDAGNSGTQYGISLHHELSSLVEAGLTPIAALKAATSAPAKAFHLRDRGRIAKGFKADLVMVEGDPSQNISATRRIVEIWKDGEVVSPLREQKIKLVAAQRESEVKVQLPPDGRISLFSTEKLASPFGLGWKPSVDAQMGGRSTIDLKVVENEPNGQNSLLLKAKVNSGYAFPWAGIAFFPAQEAMQPADLSQANCLKFKVKADGKSYNAGIFMQGSYVPLNVRFTAGADWEEISLPFSKFVGLDSRIITMINFSAGPEPGDYQMQIADIRLVKI